MAKDLQHGSILSANNDGLPNAEMFEFYKQWAIRRHRAGYRIYFVTFEFDNITGYSPSVRRKKRVRELEAQFYPKLVKLVEGVSPKPSKKIKLPVLVEVPNVPLRTYVRDLHLRRVVGADSPNVINAMIAMPNGKLGALLRDHKILFVGKFTSIANIRAQCVKERPNVSPKKSTWVFVSDWSLSLIDEILVLPKTTEASDFDLWY